MRILIFTGIVLGFFSAFGATEKITFKLNSVRSARDGFSELKFLGVENSKKVGLPSLPVKSFLLSGRPEQINVNLKYNSKLELKGLRALPVQRQNCRCDVSQNSRAFEFDAKKYELSQPEYTVTYLGAYRGRPISRLDVNLGKYDKNSNQTVLFDDVDVSYDASPFAMNPGDFKDYLILVPEKLAEGVDEFVNWKKSKGFNVNVKTLTSLELKTDIIQKYIADQYKNNSLDFVIIVGDENAVPMFYVETSSDYDTPSDLKYFTMDGEEDHIPDVFSSRITATSIEGIKAQLSKSIEYEKLSFKNNKGMSRLLGISSSEGYNPSDKEYIESILTAFNKSWSFTSSHLNQKDFKSNPQTVNDELSKGLHWIYYVGHGTGTTWPSMNNSYDVSDMDQMNNAESVKPIVIDVACMNGKLTPGYFGTTFMEVNEKANAHGSLAYLGGTVNVSWHPPALMAKGIALEHTQKNFTHLGEAVLAGQLYLSANWDSQEDVVDNFEWYHLQGDPGLNIQNN